MPTFIYETTSTLRQATFFTLAMVATLPQTVMCHITPTKTDYATLSYNIASFEDTRSLASDNDSGSDNNSSLFLTSKLSTNERISEACNLFARAEAQGDLTTNNILSLQAQKDIALLKGGDVANGSLLQIIGSHTLTPFGTARLAYLLANPTTNVDVLEKRQNIIAACLEDADLSEELCRSMHTMQPHLDELFSFWEDYSAPQTIAENTFYYKNIVPSMLSSFYDDSALVEKLNNSPLALDVRARLAHTKTALSFLSPALVWVVGRAALQKGLSLLQNKYVPTEHDQTTADVINPRIEDVQESLAELAHNDGPAVVSEGWQRLADAGKLQYAAQLNQLVAQRKMTQTDAELAINHYNNSVDEKLGDIVESLGKFPEIASYVIEYVKNKSFSDALVQSTKDMACGNDIRYGAKIYYAYLAFTYKLIKDLYAAGCTKLAIASATSALGTNALALGIPLYLYKHVVSQALDKEKSASSLSNYIQQKMSHIAKLFDVLRDIHTTLKDNKAIVENLEGYESLNNIFAHDGTRSKKLSRLIELLQSKTFAGEASFFSRRGNIMTAYKLMRDVKDELIAALEGIGHLDALMGTATFIRTQTTDDAPCCFATYELDANTPQLSFDGFWNPFIRAHDVVTNSITLGSKGASSNMLLTGPNAGGKSTVLKSVIINTLLAQTLGVAMAKRARITPFSSINTYLNIVDDITAGNSHYKAEVLRAQSLINSVTSLDSDNKYSLTICDEIFSGTNPAEGAAGAYAVASHLGEQPHSIMLLATHYPLLTTLEREQPETFTNYNVSVTKYDDGTLEYPFTLSKGISNQNIAINILELEGFDSSIIEKAKGVLAR
jgi:hypothetical protein